LDRRPGSFFERPTPLEKKRMEISDKFHQKLCQGSKVFYCLSRSKKDRSKKDPGHASPTDEKKL